MIYNFISPQVEKHNMREKIHDQQQNYMRNAYISIYEKILPLDEPSQVTEDYIKNEDTQAILVAKNTVKIDFPISYYFSCKKY